MEKESPDATDSTPAEVTGLMNPELKLSRRQQKILGIKATHTYTEKEKKRIEESTARLRLYNQKRKEQRIKDALEAKKQIEKAARVKLVEKPKRHKRTPPPSDDSQTSSDDDAHRTAKRAKKTIKAIEKLDERVKEVVSNTRINPYTAAFMKMK